MKQSGIAKQMNPARRRFLETSGRYGFTTAVLASIGGYLWSDDAIAQTAADEEAKQKAAKFTMLFATEYKNEDWSHLPIPQSQFKTNLEASSKNAISCEAASGRSAWYRRSSRAKDPGRNGARRRGFAIEFLSVCAGG